MDMRLCHPKIALSIHYIAFNRIPRSSQEHYSLQISIFYLLKGVFPLTGLLRRHFVLIVVEVLSTEQETEFGVVLLLVFRHLLELRSIASNELGQFVNYIPELRIYVTRKINQVKVISIHWEVYNPNYKRRNTSRVSIQILEKNSLPIPGFFRYLKFSPGIIFYNREPFKYFAFLKQSSRHMYTVSRVYYK